MDLCMDIMVYARYWVCILSYATVWCTSCLVHHINLLYMCFKTNKWSFERSQQFQSGLIHYTSKQPLALTCTMYIFDSCFVVLWFTLHSISEVMVLLKMYGRTMANLAQQKSTNQAQIINKQIVKTTCQGINT